MAISNYGDLKTSIATWLDRSDLTNLIPDFVALAETNIHYGVAGVSEPLRVRAMETAADVAITAGVGALPTGFLQARRVYLDTDPIVRLEFIAPHVYWSRSGASTAGKPQGYTIEGDSLRTLPTTDTSYTVKMLYYKAFTSLSSDADTNGLFTAAPGIYLNMSLYEAWSYVGDATMAQGFLAKAAATVNAMNSADKFDRFSGSPMRAFAENAP